MSPRLRRGAIEQPDDCVGRRVCSSVQRGTEPPDCDVNFLVGFTADADYILDMCHGSAILERRLAEILGRKVDVVGFIRDDDHEYAYTHMGALLTAETIWGNPTWKHPGREAAKHLLMEGYESLKKALQVASRLKERLFFKAKFEPPKNKTLRLLILEDALLLITTVQIPNNPICGGLHLMIQPLLSKEHAIRAAIEGEEEDLWDIWSVISDWTVVNTIQWMMERVEPVFSRAGLEP